MREKNGSIREYQKDGKGIEKQSEEGLHMNHRYPQAPREAVFVRSAEKGPTGNVG
jgi:hypothetical protein